jgi:hypothetical protein
MLKFEKALPDIILSLSEIISFIFENSVLWSCARLKKEEQCQSMVAVLHLDKLQDDSVTPLK